MDDKGYAEIFIEKSFNKVMGKVLDLARISEMSERSFKQFDLTVKDEFNSMSRFIISELRDRGVIPKKGLDAPGLGEKILNEEKKK